MRRPHDSKAKAILSTQTPSLNRFAHTTPTVSCFYTTFERKPVHKGVTNHSRSANVRETVAGTRRGTSFDIDRHGFSQPTSVRVALPYQHKARVGCHESCNAATDYFRDGYRHTKAHANVLLRVCVHDKRDDRGNTKVAV